MSSKGGSLCVRVEACVLVVESVFVHPYQLAMDSARAASAFTAAAILLFLSLAVRQALATFALRCAFVFPGMGVTLSLCVCSSRITKRGGEQLARG